MRINTRRRPSPAIVIASLALLVSLGGTSFAAVSAVLPRDSVGTVQLKNGAVTAQKVKAGTLLAANFKRGQLTPGPAGPTGPAGPAGATGATGAPGPTARWALFKADGTIIAQSGNIALADHSTGTYIIDFNAPVDKALILATASNATAGFRGTVVAEPCGGPPAGAAACSPGGDNNHVAVFTSNAANTAYQDHSFYVAVIPS